MPEKRTDPRKNFVPRFLPWLLAALAFAIYWLTLNRWVSLFNLTAVAKTSGWVWLPEVLNPVSFLVTYPFRWLPTAAIPVALNLFSAVCAALTLGLLARSVALLPQDRTEAQRKREHSDFSFLTLRSAWLPPVLAVIICGLQLTFWQHATNGTGEMFDLLLFAFVIWSLLEYRLDEREGRLFLAAAVYGASMADNWAMIGFFPIFIAAIVWIRGLSFFNLRFLGRMALCGLAGILFYLLLPLLAVASNQVPMTFWETLKVNLSSQWQVIELFFMPTGVRGTIGLLSLTSLLPVFVLCIRWKSGFGDNSRIGSALTSFLFHLVHAVFFVMCVWVAFDPPLSPRHLGFNLPGLTFYYLGALAVGYYSGYFLLIFGKEITSHSSRRKSPLRFVNRPIIGGVWLVAIVAVVGLFYKNTPQIRAINDNTLKKYAAFVAASLPHTGGILLSDDPRRLFLVQEALARDGRIKDFIPVETQSLAAPAYHKFLHAKFPQKWPDTVRAGELTNGVSPLHLIGLLAMLAKTNAIYYLHPSFGYYFEQFYLEPRGLIYKLQTLPNGTLLPPLPDKNQIAENEIFWTHAEKTALAPIENTVAPDPDAPRSWGEQLLDQFHVPRESNPNAIIAGTFYSRSLDFWGVQLQRAGDLTNAATSFELAQKLNPDNVAAQINLAFNRNLRAGKPASVDLSPTTPDHFGKYHTWNEMLGEDGPFDEPGFSFEDGSLLMQGGLFRQAAAPMERVRQLVPDYLPARLALAQIYLVSRLPDRALDVLREPLSDPEKFSLSETNEMQLNILAAAADFQKNEITRGSQLLELEISRHPTNDDLLIAAAQAYIMHGLFADALRVIDRKLKLTPDDLNWIYSRGYVSLQLKNYNAAIAAMSRVLAVQTNNNALFSRATAYLDSGNLDAARADYEKLGQSFTNSFQIAYGLGEIAWRKHETNAAIKNYETYLANANTNTAKAKIISQRLRELKK